MSKTNNPPLRGNSMEAKVNRRIKGVCDALEKMKLPRRKRSKYAIERKVPTIARIICTNFPDNDLLAIDTDEASKSLDALKAVVDDAGDSLFKFVVLEVAGADDVDEAIARMERGVNDLQAIIGGLESLQD